MSDLVMAVRHDIEKLREQEQYSYQIAYFILQNQRLAEEAAKKALIQLIRENRLMEEPAEELRARVKRLTVHASLALSASISGLGNEK